MTSNATVLVPMPATVSTVPPPSHAHQTGERGGDYRRLFPLSPLTGVPGAALVALAGAMTESAQDPKFDNLEIPAGYSYLGQLVAHDLTQDPTPPFGPEGATARPRNLRTPELDLDWLYGNGPTFDPHLYERSDPGKLRVGSTSVSFDVEDRPIPSSNDDLPRDAHGFAQIADMRNDGHLILSQLHLLFIKAHNRLMRSHGLGFDAAKATLVTHYRQTVLEEFLPKLCDAEVLGTVKAAGARHYQPEPEPYLPIEFACAGFRLHSMVRGSYDYNALFPNALLEQLLGFTGFAHNGGLVPIPSNWVIDWRRFFPLGADVPMNWSRSIDGRVTRLLGEGDAAIHGFEHQGRPMGLAVRTLLRGMKMGLPSGQDVALHLGVTSVSADAIAESGPDGAVAAEHGLHTATPLWYYVMKEAELTACGRRLGKVGSTIVAEVLVTLARSAPSDPYAAEAVAGLIQPGMKGLLEFVGELSPPGI
jgi:hypothetical protein